MRTKIYIIIFLALTSIFISSCKDSLLDNQTNFKPYTDLPIGLTLSQNADQYSLWIAILKKTNVYDLLNINGTFTCIVPNNDAVTKFLNGKTVDQMDPAYLKEVVKYHVFNSIIRTLSFPEGALPDTTSSGDNITSTFGTGGFNNIILNKIAKVIDRDRVCTNGIIHTIDAVLLPPVETVYDKIKNDSRYSIFLDAITKCGYAEKLKTIRVATTQKAIRVFYSPLVVPDSVFKAAGINDFNGLVSKYYNSATQPADVTNSANGVNRFIAYHLLDGKYYFSDLADFSAYTEKSKLATTLVYAEFVTVQDMSGSLVLNNDILNKTSVKISTSKFNIVAKNGVLHEINGLMPIFAPSPSTVIWEVSDLAELRANPLFRTYLPNKAMVTIPMTNDVFDRVKWNFIPTGSVTYTTRVQNSVNDPKYNFDYLDLNFTAGWIEFRTPIVVKGKYKVVFSGMTCGGAGGSFQMLVNGVQCGSPSTTSYGQCTFQENATGSSVVEIPTTQEVYIRLVPVAGAGNIRLDYIKFMPYGN